MEKIKNNLFLFIVITVFGIFAVFVFRYYQVSKKKANIILLIIDCLRADHLGCYGYARDTSPHIDKLAQEGVLFSNVFSQAGYTTASIPSIFTSKFPLSHGVWLPAKHKLSDEEITLAEILKDNGYNTAAFTGGGFTSHLYGFDQGFDLYQEVEWGDIKEINNLVFNWLEQNQNKEKPFFLFLHCYTVHEPFNPPEPFASMYTSNYQGQFKGARLDSVLFEKIRKKPLDYNSEDIDYIISQYDGGIRYYDENIGELLKKIEGLKLFSNTIVILTSDHGQDFMEHGTISHRDIYDVGIHVPLIVRTPYLLPNNKKINALVRSIDIFPTILDMVALLGKNDIAIEGNSLLPAMLGQNVRKEHPVYSLGADNDNRGRISLRTRNWKLIATRKKNEYELYNLKNDPGELINLVSTEKEQFKVLKQKLDNYIKQSKSPIKKTKVILDEETKERLKSLGYLQ
ncbi:MAG: sulfatase [Candidatus Omnitrophota bacterium]